MLDVARQARTVWPVLVPRTTAVNQLVATAMLEHLGFHVDIVADGAEAVTAATATPYRAILMDCQIPVLDGYRRDRRDPPSMAGSARRTPIIAVTAIGHAVRPPTLPGRRHGRLPHQAARPDRRSRAVLARWAPDGEPDRPASTPARVFACHRVGLAVEAGPRPPGAGSREIVARLERLGEAAGEDLIGQLATMFLADADARVDASARRRSPTTTPPRSLRSAHTLTRGERQPRRDRSRPRCARPWRRTAPPATWSRGAASARRDRGRARPGPLRPRRAAAPRRHEDPRRRRRPHLPADRPDRAAQPRPRMPRP